MCIRDRLQDQRLALGHRRADIFRDADQLHWPADDIGSCLLYTSDAAVERSSVDLGGRSIIKKKN